MFSVLVVGDDDARSELSCWEAKSDDGVGGNGIESEKRCYFRFCGRDFDLRRMAISGHAHGGVGLTQANQ